MSTQQSNRLSNPQHPHPAQERADLHNPSIREDAAAAALCGEVHLPTGRTCILPYRHAGGCKFVSAEEVKEWLAQVQ